MYQESSQPRPEHKPRNLVVVRAGDNSLHEQWIAGGRRDFDIFVSYFGNQPGRYAVPGVFHESRRGPKWSCLSELLRENAALVARYDCVWFPDDDLSVSGATIDRMFAFFHAYEMCLAQPALTRDSYCTWPLLRQAPDCHIRYSRFVEIMAPLFSRKALRLCAPTFAESASGWGLDWVWPGLCQNAGLGRLAVIDATPVKHTRPCGGELYRTVPDLDPRGDARRLLARYGAQETRVRGKYSFSRRVRETDSPAPLRMLYALRTRVRLINEFLNPRYG